MKMLETIHILPVRAESAAPAPLRGKTQKRPSEYSARESGNATRNARGRNSCPIFRNVGR